MARLSRDQWAEVRAERERHGTSYRALAAKYGVSDAAIIKRARIEGWGKVSAESPAPEVRKVRKKTRANHANPAQDQAAGRMSAEDEASGGMDSEPNARHTRSANPPAGALEGMDFEDAGFCDLFEAAGNGKYQPAMAGIVNRLAKLGLTHRQMADALGVAESTFYKWKAEHADFRTALQLGMAVADARVVDSMHRAAIGYTHEEEVIRVLADGTVVRVPTLKHYPPNPNLIIFWLKNRQPELWKERVEVKEEVNLSLFPSKEQLDAIFQRSLEKAREVEAKVVHGRAERLGLSIDDVADGE